MFGIYFAARPPQSYAEVMACDREAFNRFFHAMLDAGRLSRAVGVRGGVCVGGALRRRYRADGQRRWTRFEQLNARRETDQAPWALGRGLPALTSARRCIRPRRPSPCRSAGLAIVRIIALGSLARSPLRNVLQLGHRVFAVLAGQARILSRNAGAVGGVAAGAGRYAGFAVATAIEPLPGGTSAAILGRARLGFWPRSRRRDCACRPQTG